MQAYKEISKDNGKSLEMINNSILAVSLEDYTSPCNVDERAKLMFCGRAGMNRWFDKSLNFVILPNGVGGCNGEHSPCDAVVPSRMVDYIIQKYSSI